MKELVILHGSGANSQNHWIPSVGKHFDNLGYKVHTPDLPDADNPTYRSWVEYFEQNIGLTTDTVIVTHSASCLLVLSVLERSNICVKKVIFVSGFVDCVDDGIKELIQDSYNWEQIKKHSREFIFINSTRDPYSCDDIQGRKLLDRLGGMQIIVDQATHFGTEEYDDLYTEFPLLEKLILD